MEYRLYYDETGKVVCYTCENIPGTYILIDKFTFAQSRPDVRVLNGKVVHKQTAIITKLKPSLTDGTVCSSYDVSIVLEDIYNLPAIRWEHTSYELP